MRNRQLNDEALATNNGGIRIAAIDCCEHVLATLNSVPGSQLLPAVSKSPQDFAKDAAIDLIVVGIAQLPVRRLFISQLRKIYSDLPILVLRREQMSPEVEECIRGEFILSDQNGHRDCEIVNKLRKVMPFQSCAHLKRESDYDAVRKFLNVLNESHADPTLDLAKVAKKMPISQKRLSIILNQHVGMSFRQMLRKARIEEAKEMLATRQYSVKEVAARVGFTDSHYFSRSFKELTGQNASEYQEKTSVLN
jgi:AraC-like DNA-binding protein